MGKDEEFRFSADSPEVDPNSIKGVWELGIEPQPHIRSDCGRVQDGRCGICNSYSSVYEGR